jgi:hypothetical protein
MLANACSTELAAAPRWPSLANSFLAPAISACLLLQPLPSAGQPGNTLPVGGDGHVQVSVGLDLVFNHRLARTAEVRGERHGIGSEIRLTGPADRDALAGGVYRARYRDVGRARRHRVLRRLGHERGRR